MDATSAAHLPKQKTPTPQLLQSLLSSTLPREDRETQSRDVSPASRTSSTSTHSRSNSIRRGSFGSVKEDPEGIAQSFLYTQSSDPSISTMAAADVRAPEFCCPCGGFMGWKQIRLGGRRMSRSYSDLRMLGRSASRGWAWDISAAAATAVTMTTSSLATIDQPAVDELEVSMSGKTKVSIESLPVEVLVQIISNLAVDLPPNGYNPRNIDLISSLLTSRTLHSATLSVLYRNITVPHSIIFSKLLRHLTNYPALGTIVRRLDFSHFTSVGLGRTRQMNSEIQNLTSKTLLQCLDLLPNLTECLLQEHVENDINTAIVRKIFTALPNLQAVDFCGCSSQIFSTSFLEALEDSPELPLVLPQLKRISFHECSGLSPRVFEILLPRLVNLTHLDLCHTQITANALHSIPDTAEITHLNLSRCSRLDGPAVVNFLSTHPAVSRSLVYLNLMADPSRFRLLEEEDVHQLLPVLPTSLRSLNLGGARVKSTHAAALIPLTKHVEELGLQSAELSIDELNAFFVPPAPKDEDLESFSIVWTPPALHYLDLTRVPSISLASLYNPRICVLVSSLSTPLEVLELSEKLISPLRDRTRSNRSGSGWSVRELGRRGWYVREPKSVPESPIDDGSRSWKMGARWWGMRKIPVALGEVGGLYGHYMFKK